MLFQSVQKKQQTQIKLQERIKEVHNTQVVYISQESGEKGVVTEVLTANIALGASLSLHIVHAFLMTIERSGIPLSWILGSK